MVRRTKTAKRRYGVTLDFSVAFDGALFGRELRALVHRPAGFTPDCPIVVVMHGINRSADHYHATWLAQAEAHRFALIVPEFGSASWPGTRCYNLGNIRSADRSPLPRQSWAFTALERLVDHARDELGSRRHRFCLYGHSAGAQFVHRYVWTMGGRRLECAVAANAGWYTMPSPGTAFPYGLKGLNLNDDQVADALTTRLEIVLGTRDTDTNDTTLRRRAKAMAQGPHRLARGRTFVEQAERLAAMRGIDLQWRVSEIDGASHNDRDTAPAAVAVILAHLQRHNRLARPLVA